MSPDDPRHGTNAGYLCHRKTNTATCAACRAARVRYEKRRKYDAHTTGGRLIDPTGMQRRIRALVALGWTFARIGAELGVTGSAVQRLAHNYQKTTRRDVAEKVAAVYERMSMTVPPTGTRTEKKDASYARSVARRHGWAPPLAWDENIDDPAETPDIGTAPRTVGRPEVIGTTVEDFDWLVAQGESEEHAAERLGVRLDSFRTQRSRHEMRAS